MFGKLRSWLFSPVARPKYGGAYVPTVLLDQPANMAAQAAAAQAALARRPTYISTPKVDTMKKLTPAELARQRAVDEERARRRRQQTEASDTSSSLSTSLAIDTAVSSAWSSSDNSSSWSSDSGSSASDFGGGGGSFGGGSDGSW